MGGLYHLVDLNKGRMARKLGLQKRHGGLEAPRNSLEIPVEASQCSFPAGDDGHDGYHVRHEWSEMDYFFDEAPMKKLISDEISRKPKTRVNTPSVVARLMGVDSLPLETKPISQRMEKKSYDAGDSLLKEKQRRNGSVGHGPFSSKPIRETSLDSFYYMEDSDHDEWSSMKLEKPRPREHPQEEELQKFKKEFEAWQSTRLKECSRVVQHGTSPSEWMAQENLNKEKMVLYSNSGKGNAKTEDIDCHTIRSGVHKRSSSMGHGYTDEYFLADKNVSFCTRRKTLSGDFELSSSLMPDQEPGGSSAPTKIVILRPGLDSFANSEEDQWASSSGASEERDSIEDFLEEVKERLKCELQGKSFKRGSMVRGGGIETPYSEKPSGPKQIAQRIAKQVRESVTKDLSTNLFRSESTRSYRGELHYNGANSPEFISRDTRRILSERLRNVLKTEAHSNISVIDYSSPKSSTLTYDRRKLHPRDILHADKGITYSGDLKDEQDIQSRSFRCEPDDDVMFHKEPSPKNLIRSLSAPVSGTSFGKLLLEDPHIVTGAHIRRKHEAIESLTVKVKKRRKDRFNFREKVSSFKYSFTLKGKLFGRKMHSASESRSNERDFVKDIMSGPTVMMNFGYRPENSTEVPPSPASVCSSVHEEVWRAAYCLSPTTMSGAPLSEDNDMPQVFRDISSNLNELRKQLNKLETGILEEAVIEEQLLEDKTMELENEEESYIRDLLIASGLYDNTCDKSISRWDPFAKPISDRVFEQVEESFKKKEKDNEESVEDQSEKKVVDHKILHDLLNEVLSTVLGPPMHLSKFRRTAIGTMIRPPHGRVLLDHVWDIMRVYLCPSQDKSIYSFDSMVARDLKFTPFSELISDDVDALGKELECLIVGDLIEEMVNDMEP